MAGTGDWLVVRARTDSNHSRHGQILQARGARGGPPYLVRWADTGAEALVFPGPDAQVMSSAQLLELQRRQEQRIGRLQEEILAARATVAARR